MSLEGDNSETRPIFRARFARCHPPHSWCSRYLSLVLVIFCLFLFSRLCVLSFLFFSFFPPFWHIFSWGLFLSWFCFSVLLNVSFFFSFLFFLVFFYPPHHPCRERGTSVDLTSVEEAPSAMTITGSMNEEGLGLLSWWE